MTYELWDTETNNLMVAYDERRDALRAVCDAIARGGWQAVEDVALIQEDNGGESQFVASGEDLATLSGAAPSASR